MRTLDPKQLPEARETIFTTMHPDLAEENRAGLASGLWPGKKVRVGE